MNDTNLSTLLSRYDALLLDAYGVLVDGAGLLPGAQQFLAYLNELGKPYLVVTNDASRLPETIAARFARLGATIDAQHIVTSGTLIADFVARHRLVGADCIVLGTDDSFEYVRRAGCVPHAASAGARAPMIAVCDEEGYDFLSSVDCAMSIACRQVDNGEPISLVLPNPDIIYPKQKGEFGFTSGGVAVLIEAGLRQRYGDQAPVFERLGKPFPAMFEVAKAQLTGRLLMIGDQLDTDIAGAHASGIDSVLVTTGVNRRPADSGLKPTYVLADLTI